MFLPNPPTAPTGLAECVRRVASFIEQQHWEVQQIEPDATQFGVSQADLHAIPKVPLVPGLAIGRRHLCSQNLHANPFLQEKMLEPPRHIPLLGVNGKYMDL